MLIQNGNVAYTFKEGKGGSLHLEKGDCPGTGFEKKGSRAWPREKAIGTPEKAMFLIQRKHFCKGVTTTNLVAGVHKRK